ncbi:MAG: beta-lactamase family protein [Candidatus Pristimantibacillus lignocellulolyticus]|uniref:Beta-lactamase family protein n=1 Tax=Candidatus Pristimantibacillus lignocellulolyticus TaxID=2994561 RepID=A0A9J6ZGX5_9BACL|nr:MAG: beta-lactamase family protein [Candidatus Pristimantibacillus lignocellulolyticus]
MNTNTLSHEIKPYDVSSCIIHYGGEIIYHYEKSLHASSKLMPINSCTKSIVSALFCIAMDQQLIPSPNTRITQFFPQLQHDQDMRKQTITLEHLLTLTAGFHWTEFGGTNSFPKMTRSSDWITYVLQQPISDEPGTVMVYNSGVSQLLAAILVQSTGMSITQYADTHLFGPLGIEQYDWKIDPQGIHTGGYGLQLSAYDMLKFGLLYLNKGVWSHKRLISEKMVSHSTRASIAVNPPERGFYGWHWWSDSVPVKSITGESIISDLHYYYARGFGGQFIIIVPTLDAVIVLTREQRKKGLSPLDFFRIHIATMLMSHHHASTL